MAQFVSVSHRISCRGSHPHPQAAHEAEAPRLAGALVAGLGLPEVVVQDAELQGEVAELQVEGTEVLAEGTDGQQGGGGWRAGSGAGGVLG